MEFQQYVNYCFTESFRAQSKCTKCVMFELLKILCCPDIMVITEKKFRDYLKRNSFSIVYLVSSTC